MCAAGPHVAQRERARDGGDAQLLLTRVLYVKEMGGKTFVITDAADA